MKKNHLKEILILTIAIHGSFSYSQSEARKNVITSPTIQQNKNLSISNDSSTLSQEKNKRIKYPLTISKKVGEEQVIHDEEYLTKEIARVERHIKAIDFKVESVSSDATMKAKAENDGWFDQMNKIKASLQEKKIKLEQELKSFNN
jgi:hypothetical protein